MIIAAILAMAQTNPVVNDPAFQFSKGLIGTWEGVVAKTVKLHFVFTLEQDGTLIVSNGIIGVGSKHPVITRASFGWDPQAKQVYYLDQHGSDTIYYGHVTKDGPDLVFDFKALCGDQGHYVSRTHLTADEYSDTMKAEENGVWKDLGFHVDLHRVKSATSQK